jgi:hypothetical protein
MQAQQTNINGLTPVHDNHFDHAVSRVRAEYLEMPGLKLTPAQAARLCALDSAVCEAVLTSLVAARFLVRTPSQAFVLA